MSKEFTWKNKIVKITHCYPIHFFIENMINNFILEKKEWSEVNTPKITVNKHTKIESLLNFITRVSISFNWSESSL